MGFELQLLVGVAVCWGEDAEVTTSKVKEGSLKGEKATQEAERSTKTPEKRGLFRVTGVLGENPQPYFVYSDPQQALGSQYDPRASGTSPIKYETAFSKPYPLGGYNAQPAYQQQYVIPTQYNAPLPPAGHPAFPFSGPLAATAAPTPMVILMMPPHPGNPYGSLMLIPAASIFPHFTPNHILPYPAQAASRFVSPQYVPVPIKPYPAAHFKADYSQKPNSLQYSSYQEPSSSVEEADLTTTTPNYSSRMRTSEQYKGWHVF